MRPAVSRAEPWSARTTATILEDPTVSHACGVCFHRGAKRKKQRRRKSLEDTVGPDGTVGGKKVTIREKRAGERERENLTLYDSAGSKTTFTLPALVCSLHYAAGAKEEGAKGAEGPGHKCSSI